ncbi:hypothetical protein H2248_011848 [Termitomyces sp. 'cryptogamus']|nr:hypothetical protein H2248_011848 [Termitomyces sp. 'cryptogamus']
MDVTPPLADRSGRGGGFVISSPPNTHFEPQRGYNPIPGVVQVNPSWAPPPPSSSPWAAGAGWRYPTHAPSSGLPTPHTDIPRSRSILTLLLDTLARGIYLAFLLNLPMLYVSRVNEVFQEVQRSKPEIQQKTMVSVAGNIDVERTEGTSLDPIPIPVTLRPWGTDSGVIDHLIKSWEYFVTSLVREWETLNIISVLLSAAILTTLQVDGAGTDPYIRYSALLALVCSLMSLLYGSIYIIRFNTIRRTRKVVEWAEQAQRTTMCIWWNIWVLLALPGIWFSWSFILYLICVMIFVWRTGTTEDVVTQIKPLTALGPRIAVTCTLGLGLIYLCLVICEFRRYGHVMDEKWKSTLYEWKKNQQKENHQDNPPTPQPIVNPERLYPQSAEQPDELIPPMHTTDEKGELPTQKIFESDASMNRHSMRPDSHGLARQPDDWRSDYEAPKTFIPRLRRRRSNVEDPIQRIIHGTLFYEPSDYRVMYDLRFQAHPQILTFPHLGRPYNHIDLAQLATDPPIDRMRLFHPLLPWYIDVHKTVDNGIMVEDVIMQMYSALQSQISSRDYFNAELGSDVRERIAKAYQLRTRGDEEETQEGIRIRRVDYLEDNTLFVGLERTEDGLWEMKTV